MSMSTVTFRHRQLQSTPRAFDALSGMSPAVSPIAEHLEVAVTHFARGNALGLYPSDVYRRQEGRDTPSDVVKRRSQPVRRGLTRLGSRQRRVSRRALWPPLGTSRPLVGPWSEDVRAAPPSTTWVRRLRQPRTPLARRPCKGRSIHTDSNSLERACSSRVPFQSSTRRGVWCLRTQWIQC